jgi:hypothetical protein
MDPPSAMPHQDYTSLTKEQKRNLPHPKDRFINVEGHQPLRYLSQDYSSQSKQLFQHLAQKSSLFHLLLKLYFS